MDALGMESGLGLRFRVEVLGFQKTLRLVTSDNVRIVMSKWAKDCMFFPTKWRANKQLAGIWPKHNMVYFAQKMKTHSLPRYTPENKRVEAKNDGLLGLCF